MNASFCEVAVDPETGGVEVTKFVVVCDPGKVLRMTSFEGQLHQAMFFSQGGGLSEEFIYDKPTGVKLSTNMFEYKKPTILDLGPIDTYCRRDSIGERLLWRIRHQSLHGCSSASGLRGSQCHRKVDRSARYAGQSAESSGQGLTRIFQGLSTAAVRPALVRRAI